MYKVFIIRLLWSLNIFHLVHSLTILLIGDLIGLPYLVLSRYYYTLPPPPRIFVWWETQVKLKVWLSIFLCYDHFKFIFIAGRAHDLARGGGDFTPLSPLKESGGFPPPKKNKKNNAFDKIFMFMNFFM